MDAVHLAMFMLVSVAMAATYVPDHQSSRIDLVAAALREDFP